MAELGGSALFAARFRENAARALLLPRRRPGQRTPLWMQRQKSADLLAVASQYGSFPIVLETYREVLRDVFDVPALVELLGAVRSRHIRVVSVEIALGLAVRQLADVRLPRVLHVRGRRPAGRAPGAGTGAGSRAAAPSCSVRRSCASCSTPRPSRTWSSSSRRSPIAAAPARSTVWPTSCGGSATSEPTRSRRARPMASTPQRRCASSRGPGARCGCGSVARSAGSPSRTWPATGTRSAPRRRPASPRRGSRPPSTPLDALLVRWARTHAPFTADAPASRWGVARASIEERLQALVGDRHAARGRVPAGWGRTRVHRPRRAPSAATSLAGPTAARGGAGGARGARPLPARMAWRRIDCRRDCAADRGGRPAGGRADPGVGPGAGRPCQPASPATRPACSTSLAPPARWSGSVAGRWDVTTDAWRSTAATAWTCWQLPAAPTTDRRSRSTTPSDSTSSGAGRRSTRSCAPPWPTRAARASSSTHCGISCGRARSPTTRSRRCVPCRCLARGRRRRLVRGASWHSGHRAPRADGRSWPTSSARSARPPSADSRSPPRSWSATVSSPERRCAAEGIAGGYASVYPVLRAMEESGRARRGYFVAGLGAAQFALPGAVDRLRAIARRGGRVSPRPGGDRSGAAVWRGTALAADRCRRAAPAAARGRRVRRARRWRRGALPRTWRSEPDQPAGCRGSGGPRPRGDGPGRARQRRADA